MSWLSDATGNFLGMGDTLTAIGQNLPIIGPILGNQQQNQYQQNQQNYANTLSNPASLSQSIMNTMTPMSQEAQQQVLQQVMSALAGTGMTSGGVATGAVSDAFANQELQRQELASGDYLKAMQLAMGMNNPKSNNNSGSTGSTDFLSQIMSSFGSGSGGGGSFATMLP